MKDWNTTLQQWPNELETIARNRDNAIQTGLRLLNRPYVNRLGYCECHDEKIRRLSRIGNLIDLDLIELQNKRLSASLARDQLVGVLALVALIAVLAFDSSVFVGALLSAVVTGAATAAVLFGVLLLALALLFLAALYTIRLISALQALVDIKRRLLKEMLWYYRLQLIPTCMQLETSDKKRSHECGALWDQQLMEDLFTADTERP